MDAAGLQSYIQAGEGLTVEFKRCGGQPEDDTFETICSFANRQGGNIFLGVGDDGPSSNPQRRMRLSRSCASS